MSNAWLHFRLNPYCRRRIRGSAPWITALQRVTKQRGYFRPQVVTQLLDAHYRGEANHAEYLWDLLVLELWHHTFIDGNGYTASIPTRPLTNAVLLSVS